MSYNAIPPHVIKCVEASEITSWQRSNAIHRLVHYYWGDATVEFSYTFSETEPHLQQVCDWCEEHFGIDALILVDEAFHFDPDGIWTFRYCGGSENTESYQFYFKNKNDGLLFKLKWL